MLPTHFDGLSSSYSIFAEKRKHKKRPKEREKARLGLAVPADVVSRVDLFRVMVVFLSFSGPVETRKPCPAITVFFVREVSNSFHAIITVKCLTFKRYKQKSFEFSLRKRSV